MDRRNFVTSIACLGVASWAGEVRAAATDLVVIVHPGAPVKTLSATDLEAIFLTTRLDWSDGSRIVPFNLPPKTPYRSEFDEAVLHMDPDAVARFWIDRKVRGGNRAPRQVPNANLMTAVVGRLNSAIGYVPRPLADASVRVVATIKNGKVSAP
jgi:hypothetical protein